MRNDEKRAAERKGERENVQGEEGKDSAEEWKRKGDEGKLTRARDIAFVAADTGGARRAKGPWRLAGPRRAVGARRRCSPNELMVSLGLDLSVQGGSLNLSLEFASPNEPMDSLFNASG